MDETLQLILKEQENSQYSDFANRYAPEIAAPLIPAQSRLSDSDLKILESMTKRAIHWYGGELRKLGGLYFNHPWSMGKLLAEMDADLDTIIGALYHDLPDLQIARERKQGNVINERAFAYEYIKFLMDQSSEDLKRRQVSDADREGFIGSVHEILRVNVGLKDESPYRQRGDLFKSPNTLKATAVKFSDDLLNTRDLDRPNPEESFLPEWFTGFFTEELSFETVDELETKLNVMTPVLYYVNQILPEARKKISLKGAEKLKKFYKNVTLVNIKRFNYGNIAYDNSKHAVIVRELEKQLVSESKVKAREHAEHMIRYHINPFWARHSLNLLKEYKGFHEITAPHKWSPFDGLVDSYFDKMIRGDKRAVEIMNKNKLLQFRATILLWKIFELYEKEPNYVISGLDERGIYAIAPPAMVNEPLVSTIFRQTSKVTTSAAKLLLSLPESLLTVLSGKFSY